MEVKIKVMVLKAVIFSNNGRKIWKKLIKTGVVDNRTVVLMLPDDDYELNYYLLMYLKSYMEQKLFDDAIILTDKGWICKLAQKICNIPVLLLREKNIEQLAKFNQLVNIGDRFIYGTLSLVPCRRQTKKLLNFNGISVEDIVAAGIYHLRSYKHVQMNIDNNIIKDIVDLKESNNNG